MSIWCVCLTPPLLPLLKTGRGNSLAVQWLGLCTFTAKGLGSILGRGTKILQAALNRRKKKKEEKKEEEKGSEQLLIKSFGTVCLLN